MNNGRGVFGREDFGRLADLLASIQGRFLLSLNDRPEVRECFKAFGVESIETTYSCGSGKGRRVGEVVIRGGG